MDNINIKVHEDMGDVSERFYGFTARQWIFAIITAAIVIPLYAYGRDVLGDNICQFLVIIISGPLLGVGFVPIQGMKAEKIIPYWWRNYMAFHTPLEYKTEAELEAEKLDKTRKKKKSPKKQRRKRNMEESTSTYSTPDDKEYFDILITPEIVTREDNVSSLIRIPNSNGQYIFVQKIKLIRIGQDILISRIFKSDGEIMTYDKDGNFVGNTQYDDLKSKFKD